jgi:hypothetical protein
VQYHHVMTHKRRMMVFNTPDYQPGNAKIIDTGEWLPDLILNRLPLSTKLLVSFYKWDQADHFLTHPDAHQVFWSDASGITHLKVDSPYHKGWGAVWKALGLEVTNSPKLAKRLKEVVRISRYNWNGAVRLAWLDTSANDEKHYDGMNIMSRSFARKMGLKKSHIRGNFRLLIEDGLIKGDAIIISDKQMVSKFGHLFDVVAPKVNLKTELRTTGWTHATFNPHHAHNQAMFDVQSASWLREWLYPRALMKDTLTAAVDEALESLRNGEWPEWMILAESQAHLDEDATVRELEQAGEAFRRHYLRWQMFGMKPESSASIMGMAANSFYQRMQSRLDHRDAEGNWKPLMWLPIPRAMYGHIITHEFLEQAGYKIPKRNKDKLFFHKESASVSVPGKFFSDSFERHGTWDLDDSLKIPVREVASDATVEGVFYRKGEAVAIDVRSPNSDGEYSIIKVGDIEDFPLYHTYGDPPLIDLNKRPKFIEEVQAGQHVAGLRPNTYVADKNYTYMEALRMRNIQSTNPGVGAYANAVMVFYACMGVSPKHVTDTMGNIVDCVQQTPYKEGFEDITKATKDLWKITQGYGKVDWFLLKTRVPEKVAENMVPYDGYFTVLFNHFKKETKRYREESRAIAFRTRWQNRIPEVLEITHMPISAAGKWVRHAEERFAEVNEKHRGNDVATKAKRTVANRQVVRDMVAKLKAMPEAEAHMLTLAMYRYCVTPGGDANTRYGRTDRALFAPVDEGEESVMDIFLAALIGIGAAEAPNISM